MPITRKPGRYWGEGDFNALADAIEALGAPTPGLFVTGALTPGTPGAGATVFAVLPTTAATYPAGFTGSQAKAGVAATASAVFTIKQNGATIGTITFAPGSTVGTFAGAGASLTPGDMVTVVAPSPADATLADVAFALHGTR